ncbi:hypothetical protein GCM10027035_11490 [Emticicia sediminis]
MTKSIKISLLVLLFTLTISKSFAQIDIIGKWKVTKYEMAITASMGSDKIDKTVEEEFIYQFNADKTFTANGWINPFRGGINTSSLKGTYSFNGNEIKLTCKKDDDKFDSFFYFDTKIEDGNLVFIFDKNKVIKWFKDSKNPDDSYAKKASQTMFKSLDGKMVFQKSN